MEKGWDALDAAIDQFHKSRNEENARIAATRAGLAEEKRKLATRNDGEKIKQLEMELIRLKTLDAQKGRTISELRTKCNSLEGVRNAFKESDENTLKTLKENQARLTKSEVN